MVESRVCANLQRLIHRSSARARSPSKPRSVFPWRTPERCLSTQHWVFYFHYSCVSEHLERKNLKDSSHPRASISLNTSKTKRLSTDHFRSLCKLRKRSGIVSKGPYIYIYACACACACVVCHRISKLNEAHTYFTCRHVFSIHMKLRRCLQVRSTVKSARRPHHDSSVNGRHIRLWGHENVT